MFSLMGLIDLLSWAPSFAMFVWMGVNVFGKSNYDFTLDWYQYLWGCVIFRIFKAERELHAFETIWRIGS
jgi:hypothetical protein